MQVDIDELEQYRPVVTGHCYRMLGSAAEAEDAAQDTFVRAWQARTRFEGRSSVKTWLYRIATNVCLDALADRSRRMRPIDEGPVGSTEDELVEKPRSHWLEPVPDARVIPAAADPFERAAMRQNIRLAFVAALQHLPPRQRAALLLADVVGCSAAETAEALEMSVAAVNSALQRARATLATRVPTPAAPAEEDLSDEEQALLHRYLDAFQRYDVDELVSLLREDAAFSMPPYALWLQGPEMVRAWLLGRGAGCRGSRLVPVDACGQPAFAQYRPGNAEGAPHKAWGLAVLELRGGRIGSWTTFLDVDTIFPLFGLPLTLR